MAWGYINPVWYGLGVYKSSLASSLENIALLAMFCTILILSVFLMHEIKENVKSALKTTSRKDILEKRKLTNANKIIIGHLNINFYK